MAKKRKTIEVEDESFELDLEQETAGALDEVIEEAVAAVEREPEGESADDGEDAGNRDTADQLARAEAELTALQQRSMRTLADFENFRRRTEKEKAELRRYALYDVLQDFLTVADNISRAFQASGSAEDLKLGLEMTLRQLDDMLRRYGVEQVEAVGQPFDPTVHEAVSREESGEVEAPTVTSEMQKGYKLYDRLLRPALVNVAMPASEGKGAEVEDEQESEPSSEGELH